MPSAPQNASPCIVDPCIPGSVAPFMTALMGIVEQFLGLGLDLVTALFLPCCLDSAWTSPDLLLDFSQDKLVMLLDHVFSQYMGLSG